VRVRTRKKEEKEKHKMMRRKERRIGRYRSQKKGKD
jgi:hypothetical protein